MNYLKSKWRSVTFATLIISYILFIFIMNKRVDYLYMVGYAYIVITFILFLGTIVGIPGIILHSFFKKERAAIPFYKLAINLGSTNTNILAAYALILLRDFRPSEAIDIFESARASTKQYLYYKTLTANIALCQWKMGDVEKADETYEDLFYYPDLELINDFSLENLDEGSSKNYNFFAQDFTTMAYLMFVNNQIEKSIYFTRIALEKSPDYAPAFDNLGQIEYKKGNIDKAIEYFSKGIELRPTMVDSNYYLAKIAIENNDKELAMKHLDLIDSTKINGLSTVTSDTVSDLRTRLTQM